MRTRILLRMVVPVLVLGGCGGVQEVPPRAERATCDQLATRAIESESLDEARGLAARAAECYERLQAQRR